MKISKIIKGIMGLGIVGGTAYLAYKVGEANGEINERYREDDIENTEDDVEDEFTYDEPDDGCIAPFKHHDIPKEQEKVSSEGAYDENAIKPETNLSSGNKRRFAPLNSLSVVPPFTAKGLLLYSIGNGYISNKYIRNYLDVDATKAAEIIADFQKAGYIGEMAGNYRCPVNLKFHELLDLIRENSEN